MLPIGLIPSSFALLPEGKETLPRTDSTLFTLFFHSATARHNGTHTMCPGWYRVSGML